MMKEMMSTRLMVAILLGWAWTAGAFSRFSRPELISPSTSTRLHLQLRSIFTTKRHHPSQTKKKKEARWWSSSPPTESASSAPSPPPQLTEMEVRALFTLWNQALATGDGRLVARRYVQERPVLLVTHGSDRPCTTLSQITEYYQEYLDRRPQATILEGHITRGPDWAMDSGIYQVVLGEDASTIKLRYTLVHVWESGHWRMAHHHTSAVAPERSGGPPELSEEQVRGLFQLWSEAWVSGDTDALLDRYASPTILLLPTEAPRTDPAALASYWQSWRQHYSKGRIVQSQVQIIGPQACQDTGIYEFTRRTDGQKCRVRYRFMYVYQDQQWKISHHAHLADEIILPVIRRESVIPQPNQLQQAAPGVVSPHTGSGRRRLLEKMEAKRRGWFRPKRFPLLNPV